MTVHNKKTHETFISEMSMIRPDIKVIGIYSTNKFPIDFICSNNHLFKMAPNHILNDKSSCPFCSREVVAASQRKLHSDFILEVNDILPGYKVLDNYTNARTRLKIECPNGHIENKLPSNLLKGSGCRQCAIERSRSCINNICDSLSVRGITLLNLERFKGLEYKYDFSCSFCENVWRTTATSILISGRGCPNCATCGFKGYKPAILYYLRVDVEGLPPLYKIGITNRTVRKRYNAPSDYNKLTIIFEEYYESGFLAKEVEQQVLKCFREFIYCGSKVLIAGNTEIFTKDVLCLEGS